MKSQIIEMYNKGRNAADIASVLGENISNVRYYIRKYVPGPSKRVQHDLEEIRLLTTSRVVDQYKDARRSLRISASTASRLIRFYEECLKRAEYLRARGYINPKNREDLYAFDISCRRATESMTYLRSLNLDVRIKEKKPYLVAVRQSLDRSFPLSFDDEIALLYDAKLFLRENADRIRSGWVLKRRKKVLE